MKKYCLTVVLFAVTAIPTAICQSPSPSASVSPSPPALPSPEPSVCLRQSWSPEMHIFYGKKEVILEKLGNWSANPREHRVYVQITQGRSAGNVKLFERSKDGYTVTEWSPRETSDLVAAIDKAIMANKGVNCVGEQIKGVLNKAGKGTTTQNVAEPASASAAFAHAVKEASGDFIKTVIIFGC